MKTRRDAASIIWRTVVVAGAMLGTASCKKDPVPTTPTPVVADPADVPADPNAAADPNAPANPCTEPDPCAEPAEDPCAWAEDDDCVGCNGRGFILA